MLLMKWKVLVTVSILTIIMGFVSIQNQTSTKTKVKKYEIIGTRAIDVYGAVHNIGIDNKQAYPVSLVFIDIGCVISQRMIPYLNELSVEAKKKNVQFYGIISNPAVHWEEAQKFQKEFNVQFPLLYDANGDLANRLKPTVVPESFVFSIEDQLLYYGRINDQYADIGKFNKHIRHADLLNAITAASKKEIPAIQHQDAKGCIFESWNKEDRQITYNKDIEPLVRANCVACHQENDIGPFPLLTYKDVSRRGRMVEYVTKKGYMPIWKAQKGYGAFSNEHSLSDYQIDLIKTWVKTGMKEGEEKNLIPAQAKPKSEWKLGKPDLILKMEPYDLPASGDDQYRVFVLKNAIPKGKVIKAIDFKPGDKSVVHHTTIFIDYSQKLRQYDAEDEKPGYDAFEKGGTMEFGGAVPVCGWAPGVGPYSYPNNVGFYVEENADLAFENHYHLSGKATTDQSYIGIYFAKEQPEKYITGSIMGSQRLQIAANDDEYTKTIWTYVPTDIELFDLTPHMHYIGKEATIDVILPNGTKKPLLHIDDWDLRWQSVYTLRELTLIPKGSIITATFKYDNSEDNHDNPYYPPQEMFWGWGSNDEMCEVYFSYVPVNPNDYGKMVVSSFACFEHTYPYTERVEVNEQNLNQIFERYRKVDLWSAEGQKLLISIIESSFSDELLKLMTQQKKKYKTDATYQTNYAHLMVEEAYFSLDERRIYSAGKKAATTLYQVLAKNPKHWNASFTYGKLLLESGDKPSMKEGLEVLTKLMESQEKQTKKDQFANVYWELGKYYYGLKNDKKAEEMLKRGLTHHPNNKDLKQELASDGRIVKKTLN